MAPFLNVFKDCQHCLYNYYIDWKCTPNKKEVCGDILKNWEFIKNGMLGESNDSITIPFMYFDQREKQTKGGEIRKILTAVQEDVNISFLCNFVENILSKIIHHRNLLKNFRTLYPQIVGNLSTAELIVDFAENLTIPLSRQPQSMYWAENQISIHSGIFKKMERKHTTHIFHPT